MNDQRSGSVGNLRQYNLHLFFIDVHVRSDTSEIYSQNNQWTNISN